MLLSNVFDNCFNFNFEFDLKKFTNKIKINYIFKKRLIVVDVF